MHYLSTRNPDRSVSLSHALLDGLAPDGGLYVPVHLPKFDQGAFDDLSDYGDIAHRMLEPFFEGDELAGQLADICADTFTFEVPLREIGRETSVLELFHGPTAAFKDIGAAFLASCMARLETTQRRTVLVATSGDTGSAVAAAFHGKPNLDVIILYPKGMVSPRQEAQLTCWEGNVRTFRVRGVFDDCQRIVKEAFADQDWRAQMNLTSANSINIGRLLPQMTYYAAASLWFERRHDAAASFAIPTGNLGNALSCLYARECGFPINEVILAVNANKPVQHYFQTGEYRGFDTVSTLANAMDVGDPSNMERLRHRWPHIEDLGGTVSVEQVNDDEIASMITKSVKWLGEVVDPHTACAIAARERRYDPHWIAVTTAHPAKFDTIVEPLIDADIPLPRQLAQLLNREDHSREIDASLEALQDACK